MKKFLTRTLPIAITGLLAANTSFAVSFDSERVAMECGVIANHLDYLLKNHHGHEKHCIYLVMESSWAMNAAAASIKSGNYPEGADKLMYSERRLLSASYHCHSFSPMLPPLLMDVSRLKTEVENAVKTKS